MDSFSTAVLNWFAKYGRKNLPWQKEISSYRVWLSEIMLQQTQVSTVIPYFLRFTERFPNIELLANAPLDEVLHLWTGLGYYARARNLHKTAQVITSMFQGQFPDNLADLAALPGIGKSTAGAILAIAFGKKATILDGNVKRVLARFHAIEGASNSTSTLRELWKIAENYTPEKQVADYTQAMMDLGATICTRSQPRCNECPLQTHCSAYSQHRVADFPQRKKQIQRPTRRIYFIIVFNLLGEVLLTQRPENGIWGGLWSFPECSQDNDVKEWFSQNFHHELKELKLGKQFRHTFSHFHLEVTPVFARIENHYQMMDSSTKLWYNLKNPQAIGLAAPVKRILANHSNEVKNDS